MISRKCLYLMGIALALLMVIMCLVSKAACFEIYCRIVEVPRFTWERLGESHVDVLLLEYVIVAFHFHYRSASCLVSVEMYRT